MRGGSLGCASESSKRKQPQHMSLISISSRSCKEEIEEEKEEAGITPEVDRSSGELE